MQTYVPLFGGPTPPTLRGWHHHPCPRSEDPLEKRRGTCPGSHSKLGTESGYRLPRFAREQKSALLGCGFRVMEAVWSLLGMCVHAPQ